MTIANTNVKSSYNCNGVTREWDLGFYYDSTLSSILITVAHLDGTTETVTTNYELDGDVLTYPTVESELDPLPEGDVITISRVTPLTQTINLVQQGPLDAETLESGYDKATLQIQEVESKKQDKLIAGDNIVISEDGKISASGQVSGNVNWGNILGTLSNQTDLQTALNSKQDIISDLNTIRSGATAGSTAVQPADITDMATQTWVGEQGFLTEHQDISGKANTSLNNLTNDATSLIANNAMPSLTASTLTLGASGDTYLAPADGYFVLNKTANNGGQYVELSTLVCVTQCHSHQNQDDLCVFLPVSKGTTVTARYNAGGTTNQFSFVYAEGSEWEL